MSAASRNDQAGEPAAAGLLAALGVQLGAGMLERALTHRSFAYENGGLPTNERLELLGHDQSEHGVAEELQPFVGRQAAVLVGVGTVRHGSLDELAVN